MDEVWMEARRMNPKKKVVHAVFVLKHINDYCQENQESQDVIIRCCDGDVPCNSLFLAAISLMIRGYLKDIEHTCREPLIIAPTLQTAEVNTFFRYVILNDNSCSIMPNYFTRMKKALEAILIFLIFQVFLHQ